MATLPQLIEDDIRRCDETLRAFIASTDATAALIIDKGGFLITHQGDAHDFDLTTIGALASGAFMANQTIAGLVNETNFSSIYQQGENLAAAVKRIARQLKIAKERAPEAGLDLSVLNVAETRPLFRKKKA
jgi:hypothetical protein